MRQGLVNKFESSNMVIHCQRVCHSQKHYYLLSHLRMDDLLKPIQC